MRGPGRRLAAAVLAAGAGVAAVCGAAQAQTQAQAQAQAQAPALPATPEAWIAGIISAVEDGEPSDLPDAIDPSGLTADAYRGVVASLARASQGNALRVSTLLDAADGPDGRRLILAVWAPENRAGYAFIGAILHRRDDGWMTVHAALQTNLSQLLSFY
ncbi:MAG: hypothetical protein AAGI51_06375 [Pseudomonadota bacterium]